MKRFATIVRTICVITICLGCTMRMSMYAQQLSGTVVNEMQQPVVNAHVTVNPGNHFRVTDRKGQFSFDSIDQGSYSITITYLGAKTYHQALQVTSQLQQLIIIMKDDVLNLDNIVLTGSTATQRQLHSGNTITTLRSAQLQNNFFSGTAGLLQGVPGLTIDLAAGDVFTRVTSRGISASAQDDLGWYYVGLQEDGLPVSLVQHSYYSPDLFHRSDLMTEKVEALRGGNAAISATNAPGGVYNFISREGSATQKGELEVGGGLQGDTNASFRMDGYVSGPVAQDWFYAVGGHYRVDEGARNTDFTFSKGGQLKANLTKHSNKGFFKLHLKYLNDYTNRYTGVAATNWNDPVAAFGQDFNTSALLMPGFEGHIPDGRNVEKNRTFNPGNGVHAKVFTLGFNFSHDLGAQWNVNINSKYSDQIADWQTSISNAFVSINNPLGYFISGADFPVGQVVFRAANNQEEIARIDNSATLVGGPATYLTDGRLPNDALMGTSAWVKYNTANEWMNQITLHKKWTTHRLSFGGALAISKADVFTQGSFAYATYAPNPTMLQVTLENPNQPVLALSDETGLSNYGGLFYVNASATTSHSALFVHDRYEFNDRLSADLGLRFARIKHKGAKDRFAPINQSGGLDQDEQTAYDNSVLTGTGEQDFFNYTYDYLSFSGGINYMLKKEVALFGRYSLGHKGPELDYYFNNFSNVPINQKGEIQHIEQSELGVKYLGTQFSATATIFMSRLRNIATSNFEYDQDNGQLFYTPIQSNNSRTIGVEWEMAYVATPHFTFTFNGTVQGAKAVDWTLYNANGSVDSADDFVLDFSGQRLPNTPNFMGNVAARYTQSKLSSFVRWRYMGEREGNIANAFQLAGYSQVDLGLSYDVSPQWSVHFLMTNVANAAGLANFYGPTSFGANADDVTAEFIQNNPEAPFIVMPILPRQGVLKLRYRF